MIRCRECDHSNPDDHRFCGICGAKLTAVRPLDIDEEDPLELETPLYQFGDRSRLQPSEVNRGDRQREGIRDASSISSNGGRKSRQIADTERLPREIVEPTVEKYYAENTRDTSSGIGGPSFLGLNYDTASTGGFVYDKSRQGGFIYDTDADHPEYLLEEVPRGVSWRAWALCLLLIIGGGLGYVQWRASHHQGPDLASILSRNGATVDPSGPVMPDKSTKAPVTPPGNADAANAKDNSQSADAKKATGSASGDDDEDSSVLDTSAAADKNASGAADNNANTPAMKNEGKARNTKAAGNSDSEGDEDDLDSASASKSAANDVDKDEKSARPESDGPIAKSAKTARKTEVAEEEPAQPKTLGDKDPLLIQADKYIQGRGVRKNCATGVNLLRQGVSEGNPAASVKLGALYWSGTCVTQSKVTAYQWFSRAHSLEPKNRWVERSRNSLWASMSPEEQRKSSY